MPNSTESPHTAFPATERALRAALAEAQLHRGSFERRLAPCSLAHCRGTCCSEGVYVNAEVALVLEQIARREANFFRAVGLDLPEQVIVRERTEQGTVKRTALQPRAFHDLVADYPEHLADTACAFLREDGCCGLQLLAEARGLHPWYYKPAACWLHPISISPEGIELHDELSDPHRSEGYRGFTSQTHCGRTAPCGQPAFGVLHEELRFLGEILGRDLLAEREWEQGESRR